MWKQLIKWGEFVKLSHTVFALPFAFAAMAVAARDHRGWPGWRLFLSITFAVVSARICAMTFNRIVDRRFDAMNPRTARRHLPKGTIHLGSAMALWIVSAAAFFAVAWSINRPCFYLSPVALVAVCFYSLTKRFTDFTHVYLGLALGLAPLGAWLAVTGTLTIAPVLLSVAVVFWLAGFDIIYATQDYEFDRTHGLHSLVVRWGIKNALQTAFLAHLFMWAFLAVFGLSQGFRLAYLVGMLVILVSLLFEHWLAHKRSLKWLNYSFFRLNALISVVFLVVTLVEVVFPRFRIHL